MSLTARHLERNDIPTVVVGSARDIVEHCAVPRFVFNDFPLGNPCGRPYDRAMQRAIAETALRLLASASAPQTTVKTPFVWSDDDEQDAAWRRSYMLVDENNREQLAAAGERRRRQRAAAPGGAARERS